MADWYFRYECKSYTCNMRIDHVQFSKAVLYCVNRAVNVHKFSDLILNEINIKVIEARSSFPWGITNSNKLQQIKVPDGVVEIMAGMNHWPYISIFGF